MTRGVSRSVGISRTESETGAEGTTYSRSQSEGESVGISESRSLSGDPVAMERLGREMLYREHREGLIRCGRLLPAEQLSRGEQALLLEELRRLAGGTSGAVAVYTGRDDGEMELALGVRTDQLADAAREIIRRRLAERS